MRKAKVLNSELYMSDFLKEFDIGKHIPSFCEKNNQDKELMNKNLLTFSTLMAFQF